MLLKQYTMAALHAKANSAPAVDLEQLILSHISEHDYIENTWTFAEASGIDHQVLIGALKSLLADNYVRDELITHSYWTLTAEGQSVATNGSPEMQVMNAVPAEGGITVSDLNNAVGPAAKLGMGACMKNKWVKKEGDLIVKVVTDPVDEAAVAMKAIQLGEVYPEKECQALKKRKLINQVVRKSFKVTKGPEFRRKRVRKMADLNKSMLGSKSDVSDIKRMQK